MSTQNGSIHLKKVAILIENDFEDYEFQVPYRALQKSGAETIILGSRMNEEYHGKRGIITIKPNGTAAEVRSEDFDAIFIPGGSAPDKIRSNINAIRLIMDGMGQNKLIAAVCHGPQVLIEADQIRQRRVTGFSSIRKDIQNAGATYLDQPVVVDGNLLTARKPADLPMFTTKFLSLLDLASNSMVLPDIHDESVEWWKLGEMWGGSSRADIVNALNKAFMGEQYTLTAFREYDQKLGDQQLSLLLKEVILTKQSHVRLLEMRLQDFQEQVGLQAMGTEALATLQSWLQSTNDSQEIMRRALGDIQTGLYDAAHLSAQLTDPKTVEIFEQIHTNLCQHEQLMAELYRNHSGEQVQAPSPRTIPLVS